MFEDSTQVVRQGVERACRDFSQRIAPLGFTRTRKMFWTRLPGLHTIDFIHLFRSGSSYGKPINYSVSLRVHLGIRVLNDTFEAAALNGPCSDDMRSFREGRYHLRFNASTGSTYERCIDDLARFVTEQGVPWFERFKMADALLDRSDTPLRDAEKQYLRGALSGAARPEALTRSLTLLGIKQPPSPRTASSSDPSAS